MIHGIDISAYQPNCDWAKVAASGWVQFCYAKATEGANYVSEEFAAQHDGCKAHGIAFGAYHFWNPGEDPVAQAEHFLATINGRQGTLLPMVDVEVSDGFTREELQTRLVSFVQTVEKSLNGKKCIIYSSYAFWNDEMGGYDGLSGHPFWVAEYNDDDVPTLPNGFTSYAVWQYTDSVSIPGIGNVDGDRLNGSLSLASISR